MFAALGRFLKSNLAYEARPWFCLFVGMYSVTKIKYVVPGVTFGLILLFCAASIFYLRANARSWIR